MTKFKFNVEGSPHNYIIEAENEDIAKERFDVLFGKKEEK